MGCFNYRCGVSNANILHGDEVAVVFFSLQHSYDDVPVRAPVFFAEYNDYGWFEELKPETLPEYEATKRIISDFFHKGYCEMTEYRAGQFIKPDAANPVVLDDDQFQDLVRDAKIHCNAPKGMYPQQIGMMMIHRRLYELLTQDWETAKDWSGNSVLDKVRAGVLPPPFKQLMVGEVPDDLPKGLKCELKMALIEIAMEASYALADFADGRYRDLKRIFDLSKFADGERTVRDATQITMLVENFRKYNLQWTPSDWTGQEYTYKDGIEYHQMCLGVLAEKQKARNERYGEYDEDEDE